MNVLRASRQVTHQSSAPRQGLHRFTDLVNCGSQREWSFTSVFSLVCVSCHCTFLLVYPVTPWLSTLQISQLHYINLLCLDLSSCKKNLLTVVDHNLLLQYLFPCRVSIDVMVPRDRQGGETASVMRMVAPHWYIVSQCLCVHLDWGAVSMTTICTCN